MSPTAMHVVRTRAEITEILRTKGLFNCPAVPHYRYEKMQKACEAMIQDGLVMVRMTDSATKTLKPTLRFFEKHPKTKVGVAA